MKINRVRVPLDGSALAGAVVEAALDLSRGEPSTLVLLPAAEAHTLPGADPTAEQVAVVREAEPYLAAVADSLAKRGIKSVERGCEVHEAAGIVTPGVESPEGTYGQNSCPRTLDSNLPVRARFGSRRVGRPPH